ncbi:MAG: efflux RND transporter periplasmic adaptor subunit [Pseudomonadales bacterium]|nr:efflux RND transporter periplasmic adaptor subunit [Pseudomonadales bacterium]MCP5185439.1 efflux RND transporter periplasmic adaptor subunit [Pseudomonadales bacterium]
MDHSRCVTHPGGQPVTSARRASGLATLLLALCTLQGCDRPPPPEPADQSIRPARIQQVRAQTEARTLDFVGRVEAAQVVDLKFEVTGTLAMVNAREGETIRAGEAIAVLDPQQFRLAVREAEVQLQLAQQDLDRKSPLLRSGVISRATVDEARSLVDLRQVHLAQARKRLADTTIRAPFDAYVLRRYVDNHVYVNAGEAVARLADLRELVVAVSIPERLLATVGTDQVVATSATFPFAPQEAFPLVYRENKGEADPVAQTYDVTFTMQPPEKWNILPGMTARVTITLTGNATAPALVVPGTALTTTATGNTAVWVYDPQTQAVSERHVAVTPGSDGDYRVGDGLADGEWIIVTGAHQLQAGMRVTPLTEDSSSP